MGFNIISAAEAASYIKHGYNIGLSGFTPAGTPKAVTPEVAKIAEEEGFDKVRDAFLEITKVEKIHEARYKKLRENILQGKVFKKDNEVIWKCSNCGYHFFGKQAPERCPSCMHKQEYFELFSENY